jgi:hypothetical protein
MAVDIVTRAENGAPFSTERLDLNFANTRTALDDLYVKFAAGIRIISLAATEDGAGLIMIMSDESVLGPIPFPMTTSRLRGPWMAGGVAYQLRDQVYVDGVGSAVARVPHESGPDFQADLDAGRWQMVAADGADAEPGGGGGGGGGGKILMSAHLSGTLAVGARHILMIPVDAVGLGNSVLWHLKLVTAPGAGESVDWEISHVSSGGALAIAWGTISGTTQDATTWIGDAAEFSAGDTLAISITAASAGSAAADLVVGVVLGEAAA